MKNKPRSKTHKTLRVGEIVYLVNVGFPFNRNDEGHDSWEGVSGVVAPNPAQPGSLGEKMIYVRTFRPMRTGNGETMDGAFFYFPRQVKRENRPWLRKNLRKIFQAQKELAALRDELVSLFGDEDY